MNKYFFFIITFFLHLQVSAQLIKKNNECIGFDKFILDAPITNFIVSAIEGGKYKKDGREFTIYGYGGERIELMGDTFQSMIITFNDSNKLVSFSFLKFYKKNDTKRFEKEARKFYEHLRAYIAGELNREGEKKIYYESTKTTHSGHEWAGSGTLLKVTKYTNEHHSVVEFAFGVPGF